jgi:hypothetical protein
MCEDCEEAEPLREVYLARRARMAATWTPRRRWIAEAAVVETQPADNAAQNLIAAE